MCHIIILYIKVPWQSSGMCFFFLSEELYIDIRLIVTRLP